MTVEFNVHTNNPDVSPGKSFETAASAKDSLLHFLMTGNIEWNGSISYIPRSAVVVITTDGFDV